MVKNFGFGPEPNRYIVIEETQKKIGSRWVTTKVRTNGRSETQYRNDTNLEWLKMGLGKEVRISRSFGNLYGKRSVTKVTIEYSGGNERLVGNYFETMKAREILKNIRRP